MIFLDTSVLVECFTGSQVLLPSFREKVRHNELMRVSSVAMYEWLRGPRFQQELDLQEAAFPPDSVQTFNSEDAIIAARLYRTIQRPRGREVDLMIAACAIRHDADLWTLNPADFKDIPDLRLLR